MPQLIVRYNTQAIPVPSLLTEIGQTIRPFVAEMVSTEGRSLTEADIDWILQPNAEGSIAPKVAIELRTIGFPERKKKLDKEAVLKLKAKLLEAGLHVFVKEDEPLIWVQFINPDGVHV